MGPDLALDAVAAYRLTRLVAADTITRPLRVRVIRWAYKHDGQDLAEYLDQSESMLDDFAAHDDEAPKLAALVTCRWCVGVYVGFAVMVAHRGRWWAPVRDGLALASAAALIAGLEQS